MFDLFGKKQKAQYDRAYAEFISGDFNLSHKILSEIIQNRTKDYKVFNLRALCMLKLGDIPGAFTDSKLSIDLEPNININESSYLIRNDINLALQKGTIKVDLFELINYLGVDEVIKITEINIEKELNKLNDNIIKDKFLYTLWNYVLYENKRLHLQSNNYTIHNSKLNAYFFWKTSNLLQNSSLKFSDFVSRSNELQKAILFLSPGRFDTTIFHNMFPHSANDYKIRREMLFGKEYDYEEDIKKYQNKPKKLETILTKKEEQINSIKHQNELINRLLHFLTKIYFNPLSF